MQNKQMVLFVDCGKTILTSTSLFYKTENFIKQTKHISNLDILLSKLCESIVFNKHLFEKSKEPNFEESKPPKQK